LESSTQNFLISKVHSIFHDFENILVIVSLNLSLSKAKGVMPFNTVSLTSGRIDL
jgi:hypothetical protein